MAAINITRFSVEEDDILIGFVEAHRELFDKQHPKYSNIFHRELLWNKVSESLNRTVFECKKRWRILRDYYRRIEKKSKSSPTASEAIRPKIDRLSFIGSVGSTRETTSSETPWEFISLRSQSSESTEEQPIPKRSRFEHAPMKNTEEEQFELINDWMNGGNENEMDKFFSALASTAKKFSPSMQIDMKLKMQSEMAKFERDWLKTSPGNSSEGRATSSSDEPMTKTEKTIPPQIAGVGRCKMCVDENVAKKNNMHRTLCCICQKGCCKEIHNRIVCIDCLKNQIN